MKSLQVKGMDERFAKGQAPSFQFRLCIGGKHWSGAAGKAVRLMAPNIRAMQLLL